MDGVETSMTIRALHDEFAGPLYVFALRSLGDPQAAEEVVQDTLVRAWQHADTFDPERGSLAAWLFAIARNLVVDDYRRRGARPRTEPMEVEVPVEDRDLDRALEAWQVADALSRLSAEHRNAIVEVHYRGASVAEAASRLGIPEGTVKSRVYYGLRALRLELEEMGVVS